MQLHACSFRLTPLNPVCVAHEEAEGQGNYISLTKRSLKEGQMWSYLLSFVHRLQYGQIQVFQGSQDILVFTKVLGKIVYQTQKKKNFNDLNKLDRAVGVLLRRRWCDTSVTQPVGRFNTGPHDRI